MCDIIKNTAGGKEFEYCREHRVESKDCPKEDLSRVEALKAVQNYCYSEFGRLKPRAGAHVPSPPRLHNWFFTANLNSQYCLDCGVDVLDYQSSGYKECSGSISSQPVSQHDWSPNTCMCYNCGISSLQFTAQNNPACPRPKPQGVNP